jgi:hypothetical protein
MAEQGPHLQRFLSAVDPEATQQKQPQRQPISDDPRSFLYSGKDATKPKEDSVSASDVGNIISDMYENMSDLDKAALWTAPVPIAGDIVGGIADIAALSKDPSLMNLGFLLAGLIPFVPSGGITKGIKALGSAVSDKAVAPLKDTVKQMTKETLGQAMPQASNYLSPFYKNFPGAKAAGAGEGLGKGLSNLIQARYSPKARALWKEEGISVADTKAANKAIKDFQNPKIPAEKRTMIGKKAVGQFRQTALMGEQYKNPSKFHKISQGLDEVAFGNFNTNDYVKIMDGATGLTRQDLNSVFKHIGAKDIQNVNPKKTYQMTVRRTNTQAAGNLDNFVFKRPIFGGNTLGQLKKNVFKGKKFKSNEEFLKALQASKVRIRNPEEVLQGRPAIVTGSVNSDAIELGGVNYMTAIKKDGNLVSFMSDEHDLFKMKLPMGDRMLNISTPITIDILKKTNRPKRLSPTVKAGLKTLNQSKQAKAKEVIAELKKYPGVDTSLKTPKGMTRAQFYAVQAVANMNPKNPDYSRILKEVGLFTPMRMAKSSLRGEEEEKKGGGSVMERNPYNYKPKAI